MWCRVWWHMLVIPVLGWQRQKAHWSHSLAKSASPRSQWETRSQTPKWSKVWWCTLLIPPLGKKRQVNLCETEASVVYIKSSRQAGATRRSYLLVLRPKDKTKQKSNLHSLVKNQFRLKKQPIDDDHAEGREDCNLDTVLSFLLLW